MKDDGAAGVYLDSAGGPSAKCKKSGGFQEPYEIVNVSAMQFSKAEQDRCIFGMTATEASKVLGQRGTTLMTFCRDKVRDNYKNQTITLKQCHVLFHWNDHSFFKYHQDNKGDVAVIVNLSPGVTSFHVAGCATATMDGPGSGHIISTKAYHRSGEATRRCIKLVYFFDVTDPVSVGDDDGPAGPSSDAAPAPAQTEDTAIKTDPVVKTEPVIKSEA